MAGRLPDPRLSGRAVWHGRITDHRRLGTALFVLLDRRTLPSVDDLQNRASQFETTRILDRNGNPLYEILDPTAGRRTYVTLDKISPC